MVWLRLIALYVLVMAALALAWRGVHAQETNLCVEALPYQADATFVQRFRQQCTIQNLFEALRESETRRIAAEVQTAVETGHGKALIESQAPLVEYWKNYVQGVNQLVEYWNLYVAGLQRSAELAAAASAVCAWRGTINEPTAKMCKIVSAR